MQSLFNDGYTLSEFNDELLAQTQGSLVNEIQLIVATDRSKLSVVLNPLTDITDYHGIHPNFDQAFLVDAITRRPLRTAADFWRLVEELIALNQGEDYRLVNLCHFHQRAASGLLHYTKEAYEATLLGQCILQTASHFGFKFYTDLHDFARIKQITLRAAAGLSSLLDFDEEECCIFFQGLWPGSILEVLDQHLAVQILNHHVYIVLKSSHSPKTLSLSDFYFEGDHRHELYSEHFRLCGSGVYYSGVMPSVDRLHLDTSQTESRVKYLTLDVLRTTFATVDTMDNPEMLNHPFFDPEHKAVMEDFYAYEDQVQEKYLHRRIRYYDQAKTEALMIEKVNDYLARSFNTHTVAVSANIVTADNYLLLGKRNPSSIDGGEYYCSANGQSEFRDANVDYYKKSVFEDLPTLDYHSDFRVDLNGEMSREAIAELGISQYHNEWNYYGISYLNINNDGQQELRKRRMHFNVLMKNQAVKTFEDIDKYIGDVTEDFENSVVEGIQVKLYRNLLDRVMNMLNGIVTFAYNHSGLVALSVISIFSIINTFFNVRYSFVSADFDTDLGSLLDLFIAVSFIAFSAANYMRRRGIRRKTDSIRIDVDDLDTYISDRSYIRCVLDRFAKKGKKKSHAIFVLMLSLYVLDLKREYDEG